MRKHWRRRVSLRGPAPCRVGKSGAQRGRGRKETGKKRGSDGDHRGGCATCLVSLSGTRNSFMNWRIDYIFDFLCSVD